MHSPLPDSRALEAGIVEDAAPSRLSRVQDNVRNLLRASILGSVYSSPGLSSVNPSHHRTPMPSPIWRETLPGVPASTPSGISPPTTGVTAGASPAFDSPISPELLAPPSSYQNAVQHLAYQSALFNTRAVAALDHPDLSDPSLAVFLQQEAKRRQRQARKRSKRRSTRDTAFYSPASQWLICVVIGLALAGMLATYIALGTTSTNVVPSFHILFVLGILLVATAFIHTALRLCFLGPSSSRHRRHRERHHRRHHIAQHTHDPHGVLPDDTDHFVPPTPIPVQLVSDDINPDSIEAQPSSAIHQPSEIWDKDLAAELPNPPPAYGRWRGSVRANPDLLHWQAVPSPTDSDVPDLPSPTYEAMPSGGMAGGGVAVSSPTFVARESPARTRGVTQLRPGFVRSLTVEPEMIERRGTESAE